MSDRELMWAIIAGVLVVVDIVVMARWALVRYIDKATIFVPIEHGEGNPLCDCGGKLWWDKSIIRHRMRVACTCGNVWMIKYEPGDSRMDCFAAMYNAGPVCRGTGRTKKEVECEAAGPPPALGGAEPRVPGGQAES